MTDLLCALLPPQRRRFSRWGLVAAIVATASASVGTTVLLQRARLDDATAAARAEPVCDASDERMTESIEPPAPARAP
jgi:hypothetical protein